MVHQTKGRIEYSRFSQRLFLRYKGEFFELAFFVSNSICIPFPHLLFLAHSSSEPNGRFMRKLVLLLTSAFLFAVNCDTSSPTGSSRTPCSLVWQDTFDTSLHSRWDYADWTFVDNLCEFTADMVAVQKGKLELTISEKSQITNHNQLYWAAEIFTKEKYQTGVFKTIMKPDGPAGTIASFLLRGQDSSQDNFFKGASVGFEFRGVTQQVTCSAYWNEGDNLQIRRWPIELGFDASEKYHEFSIEWMDNKILFYADDRHIFTLDDAAIIHNFQQPMSLHANFWISSDKESVGEFNANLLPIKSTWDSIAYYKLVST